MEKIHNYLKSQTSIQTELLDKYRLTEKFKKEYGNYIINNYPDGTGVKNAINNIKKYKKVENVSIKKYRKTIIDLLYITNVLGFLPWEYFTYHLEKKKIKDWLKFIPQKHVIKLYNYININNKDNEILDYKYLAYNKMKNLYKRDIILIKDENDYNIFENFCLKHKKFIIKPSNQAFGNGIKILKIKNKTDIKKTFKSLIKNGDTICEELITNHLELKKFHPKSVNSLRIITYNYKRKTKILYAWFKCGINDLEIDNGSAGGLISAVDINTGKIISNASSENNEVYKKHPNTNYKFKNFIIPHWDECKKTVLEATKMLPNIYLIGWDITLSQDKGWQIIEGNRRSQTNIYQAATKKGFKEDFLKEIEYDQHFLNYKKKTNKKHL